MSGFSKIFTASLLFRSPAKNAATSLNQIRSSHGRQMFLRPGNFYTKKYFDIMHYHFVLAGLPFALFIAYQNWFVGPARLTELPADAEPRYWEYIRHPIKRFLAKHIYPSPEQQYENHLHWLYQEQCKQKMRALESKVRNMMINRNDYKGWYYVPVQKETFELKTQFEADHKDKGYKILQK